jgi:hypothetical protein
MNTTIRLTERELKKIINESVKRILKEDVQFELYGQHYNIKGPDADKKAKALMKKLITQRKAERGEKVAPPPKKRQKPKEEVIGDEQSSPKALAANVKNLVTDTALISVKGFIDHSQRQFGINPTNIVLNVFKKEAGGTDLFVKYNGIYRNILATVDEIVSWGRKNEYAVYERVRKLAYLLQDMSDVLDEMGRVYNNLVQKKVFNRVLGNDANIIYGNGHSLGLRSLIFAKGGIALSKLTGTLLSIANKLMTISDNGRDPLDYETHRFARRG